MSQNESALRNFLETIGITSFVRSQKDNPTSTYRRTMSWLDEYKWIILAVIIGATGWFVWHNWVAILQLSFWIGGSVAAAMGLLWYFGRGTRFYEKLVNWTVNILQLHELRDLMRRNKGWMLFGATWASVTLTIFAYLLFHEDGLAAFMTLIGGFGFLAALSALISVDGFKRKSIAFGFIALSLLVFTLKPLWVYEISYQKSCEVINSYDDKSDDIRVTVSKQYSHVLDPAWFPRFLGSKKDYETFDLVNNFWFRLNDPRTLSGPIADAGGEQNAVCVFSYMGKYRAQTELGVNHRDLTHEPICAPIEEVRAGRALQQCSDMTLPPARS
jgi:hypothetical protein